MEPEFRLHDVDAFIFVIVYFVADVSLFILNLIEEYTLKKPSALYGVCSLYLSILFIYKMYLLHPPLCGAPGTSQVVYLFHCGDHSNQLNVKYLQFFFFFLILVLMLVVWIMS